MVEANEHNNTKQRPTNDHNSQVNTETRETNADKQERQTRETRERQSDVTTRGNLQFCYSKSKYHIAIQRVNTT